MDKQSTEMALACVKHRKKFKTDNPEPLTVVMIHSKYGLSAEILQTVRNKLNRHCSLCGKKSYLILDHNHKTKKARGFICKGCNMRIAGLDDEQFRAKALAYLNNPPLQQFYT